MTAELLKTVQLDEEGFLVNPDDWTPELAEALAKEEGIELTEKHWQVIHFCREKAKETGASPTLREISVGTGIPIKDLFQLFPKAPAKRVARIAGLKKPQGCI